MTTLKNNERLSASFRDPSGFLFTRDEKLYRQVNHSYSQDYAFLIESGLYDRLLKANLLIPHAEAEVQPVEPKSAFKVICPERVRFISYPYEWSFSQLKDAALATLAVQKHALKFGMSLKDASAYNIQFHNGRPILIDTLSFEVYKDGAPWVAYRQFCQHFLAPLALMAKTDVRLSQLMRVYIDGVPLDLASRLLPASTRFNFGLLTHIHLHARAQMRYADAGAGNDRLEKTPRGRMTKQALQGLIESLESTVKQLEWNPVGTEWGDYYNMTNYTDSAFEHKKDIISEWVHRLSPRQVWDVGANNGVFTRLASVQGIPAIAFDIDPAAVEQNYRQVKSARETNILPLVQDLTNPSPSLGWHTRERDAFLERAPADMVFALAVIHHLAISNNVPLPLLAEFFHDLGKWLVIEFVPKTDSQVQKLLASRLDIFDQYTVDEFERIFGARFAILEKVKVRESERFLYLMEKRD
ncbi:MAG: SAM-dependent methyltransferase [Chloroflexi bacterium]|nr:SAM-dependent methyltransferase [Chloroflexota bacterium]MDL1944207.1 class I SAM-dependent methyltransferase [Chloroflexi bacterium CFX2]